MTFGNVNPFTVGSSNLVANLNADELDSQDGSYYPDFSTHSIATQAQGDLLTYTGTALRGPNWDFYWPWQAWPGHPIPL